MSLKQMVLTFSEKDLFRIKEKCTTKEKRSLTAQLRSLLEQIPNDIELLKYFKWKYHTSYNKPKKAFVKTAIKLPEDEYWVTVEKASKSYLTPVDFCSFIMVLWEIGGLGYTLLDPTPQSAAGNTSDYFFKTGNIKLSYNWNQDGVEITWDSLYFVKGELWLIFLHPDTDKFLSEILLGSKQAGKKTYSSQKIGFSPSNLKPSIKLIVKSES